MPCLVTFRAASAAFAPAVSRDSREFGPETRGSGAKTREIGPKPAAIFAGSGRAGGGAGADPGERQAAPSPAPNRQRSRRENVSRHKEEPGGVVKGAGRKFSAGGYRSRPSAAASRAVSAPRLP